MAFTQHMSPRLHYVSTSHEVPLTDQAENERRQRGEHIVTERRRVLLIHGLFFGNLAGWFPTISQPLSRDADVLCYDLRGHGLSEMTDDGYTLGHHVDDACALLKELGWTDRPISVVGHSFGGRVALKLAERSEVMLDQIILIDSPLSPHDGERFAHDARQWRLQDRDHLGALLPHAVHALINRGGRRFQRLIKRWHTLLHQTTLISDLERDALPTVQELSSIAERLWALYGGRSGCLSSWHILRDLVPEERRAILPEGGHFLLNEAPMQVSRFTQRALTSSDTPLIIPFDQALRG